MEIQRADVLSKIGRDIVIFWFLSFILFSYHSKIEVAHNRRLSTAGAFNTLSIARALAIVEPDDIITQEELRVWLEPLPGLPDLADQSPLEGFDLGPLDIAFVLKIKPFGLASPCSVLVRLMEVGPEGGMTYMVHPAFTCIFGPDYSVFPTRLVAEIGEDGFAHLQDIYFSRVWDDAFELWLGGSGALSWCDIQGYCYQGEYEPVDFGSLPQPYFTDERMGDEFRIPAALLPTGTMNEVISVNNSPGKVMGDEAYSNALREAEKRHRRPSDEDFEEFFGFPAPVTYLPFLGILLATYLTGTIHAHALLLRHPLQGDGAGQILGPARRWSVVQHMIKALMIVTPIMAVLLTGAVFQDVFRRPILNVFYINPLDGVFFSSSRDVDMGRAMVSYELYDVVFNIALVIWVFSVWAAIKSTGLLLQTFRPSPR